MLSISELPGSISRLFIHPECAWPGWASDGVAARGFVSGRGPQAQRIGKDSPAGAYRPKPTRPGTRARSGGIRTPEHAAATGAPGGYKKPPLEMFQWRFWCSLRDSNPRPAD